MEQKSRTNEMGIYALESLDMKDVHSIWLVLCYLLGAKLVFGFESDIFNI